MQFDLSLLIKIIIRRRHRIRHARLTPVRSSLSHLMATVGFFFVGFLYLNMRNSIAMFRKFEMAKIQCESYRWFSWFFFHSYGFRLLMKTDDNHSVVQLLYMFCCVHVLLIRIQPEIPKRHSIHFAILLFVVVIFYSFFSCYFSTHALHSHSEHNNFLASNDVSNRRRKKTLTYRQDTFRF